MKLQKFTANLQKSVNINSNALKIEVEVKECKLDLKT